MLGALAATPARAGGQYELFGVNPRGKGMAGAQVASTADASATYYNPAGLSELKSATGFVALAANVNMLYVDTQQRLPTQDWRRPQDPENYQGLTLGGAIPLGGKFNRIVIGVSAYAPRKHVLSVRTLDPQQPHFFFYEAQPDRYELLPAVALRITDYSSWVRGFAWAVASEGPPRRSWTRFWAASAARSLMASSMTCLPPPRASRWGVLGRAVCSVRARPGAGAH